jgi:predicted secreted Zn-dependent protease
MRSVTTGKWHYALLVGMGWALMSTGALARAQQAQQWPQASPTRYQIPQPPAQQSQPLQAPGEAETLHVLVGQSLVVSSPAPIKRISVAKPGIIDAVEENPNQVQISGKAPGDVSLFVWDETGQSQEFDVNVDLEDRGSAEQLPEGLPGNPAGAEVRGKKIAWLGWAVMASIVLLTGVVLRVRHEREPYLGKLDLGLPKTDSPDGHDERVLAAPYDMRAEEHPVEEALTRGVTGQAEEFENIIQEVGEPWPRQAQDQGDGSKERLREGLKNLGLAVEQSKQQLASLTEAKLDSVIQAARDEYGRQMAQAFQEQAQAMHAAADGEVKSIKQAAEEAIAQLQAAEQARTTNFQQMAQAFQEQAQAMCAAADGEVKSIKQAADEAIAQLQAGGETRATNFQQMAQAFQEQAQAMHATADGEAKSIKQAAGEAIAQLQAGEETRATNFQQMVQAFREQAQAMHAAADGEAKSIKQAAGEAIAQLQAAEQERATSFLACAGAAEERLTGVSSAVEALQGRMGALVEDLQGKQARQAEDLEKIAQQLGGRLAQQFQEQAEAAVERLREELKNLGRAVEDSKQQLASLAEAKAASLIQAAANATASIEAEQRQVKSRYATSRREFEDLSAKRRVELPPAPTERGKRPRKRADVVEAVLVVGVFLAIAATLLGVYLWTTPGMQLRAEAPAEFIDQSPNWSAKRRVREAELAQAYWKVAAVSLQEKYPFGSELPADPPTEFQVDNKYAATDGAKAASEARAHYWEKLRQSWVQRQSWVERYRGNTGWADRVWQIWDQLHFGK